MSTLLLNLLTLLVLGLESVQIFVKKELCQKIVYLLQHVLKMDLKWKIGVSATS